MLAAQYLRAHWKVAHRYGDTAIFLKPASQHNRTPVIGVPKRARERSDRSPPLLAEEGPGRMLARLVAASGESTHANAAVATGKRATKARTFCGGAVVLSEEKWPELLASKGGYPGYSVRPPFVWLR